MTTIEKIFEQLSKNIKPKNGLKIIKMEIFHSGDWFVVLEDEKTGLKAVVRPERKRSKQISMRLSIKQGKEFSIEKVKQVEAELLEEGLRLFDIYMKTIKEQA